MVIHMRVGDSFVADVNRFAQAVVYATDNGAQVVQEALGTLNNSSLARQSVDYAYNHGVTVIASAADEAAQHNNWPSSLPHVILVNSVTTTQIEDQPPMGTGAPISYLAFNGCTNFNSKVTLAIPSRSCSSDATAVASGMAGLAYSAAYNAFDKGSLEPHPDCMTTGDGPDADSDGPDPCVITANEVRQIMASGSIDGQTQPDDVNFASPSGQPEPSCSPAPTPGCTDPNDDLQALVDANRPSIVPASESYPARRDHDQFYGYGRVNMQRAVNALVSDPVIADPDTDLPPEAEITSPDWYQQIDPARATFRVRGQVFARGDPYTCEVFVAPGHYPNNSTTADVPPGDFEQVPSQRCDGSTSRTVNFSGVLANIDVSDLQSRFPPETQGLGFDDREPGAGVQSSNGRPNTDPYGFVVKVVTTTTEEGDGLTGEDQRAGFLHRDQDMLQGFPKAIARDGEVTGGAPTGDGESSPAFADLDGDNRNEMIFATTDGFVHALRPNGSELAGWPVRGDVPGFVASHAATTGFQSGEVDDDLGGAILASAAVGDANGDGLPEVYAADLEGKVYGWDAQGNRILTEESNIAFSGKPLQPFENVRQGNTNRTQHGFIGSPVLANIDGDPRQELIAAAMDRHVYAWETNDSSPNAPGGAENVQGFPVLVVDPGKLGSIHPATHRITFDSNADSFQQGAIIDTPAIADIAGNSRPEIVIGTNEEYDETMNAGNFTTATFGPLSGSGVLGAANSRLYALKPDGDSDGNPSPVDAIVAGWPFRVGIVNAELLPVVGEGITGSPVIGPVECPSGGSGAKIGVLANNGPAYILNPNATSCYGNDPTSGRPNALESDFAASGQQYDHPVLPAVGHPSFGDFGTGQLTFFSPAAGLLRAGDVLLPEYQGGQDFVAAWAASTSQFQPGFPAPVNDLQFLTGPSIGDIDGAPGEEAVAGTASKDLAAFNAVGAPVNPKWPKVSTDWTVANPLIGSFGTLDTQQGARKVIVGLTRSGYINAYETDAPACSPSSWPRFHHDNANSGDFERDATLPGKPTALAKSGGELTFTAPGDDLLCGDVDHYEVATANQPIGESSFNDAAKLPDVEASAEPGQTESYPPPLQVRRYVAIRAVDDQGNVGRVASIEFGGSGGGPPQPPGAGPPGGEQPPSDRCANAIDGTKKSDQLTGGNGGDRIRGRRGKDRIDGGGGDDCLKGGRGRDRLTGGTGEDEIKGGRGRDRVRADDGEAEVVGCGKGRDRVVADRGDEIRGCEKLKTS
jgi:hypothetical protein